MIKSFISKNKKIRKMHDICDIYLDRMVYQDLWFYNMPKPYCDAEEEFSNAVFTIKPYSWADTNLDEPDPNEYHFYHFASGLKIQWYKYPLRGVTSNMEITPTEFRAIICDCRNSVNPSYKDCTFEKWWENNGSESV